MPVAQFNRSLIEENAHLKAQTAQMAERLSVLEQQVAWFKRQLFGRKSEKQIIDRAHQPLLDGWQDDASAEGAANYQCNYSLYCPLSSATHRCCRP